MSESIESVDTSAAAGEPTSPQPAADSGVPSAAAAVGLTGGGESGTEPIAEPAWHEGRGYSADTVQLMEAKGWHKSENPAEELGKAYRNLERLRGVPGDQLLRKPEAGNEEQQAEFRAALGVPESAEGYESPSVAVNGVPLEAEPLAAASHVLGHTPEQHSQFMEWAGQFIGEAQQQAFEARNAQLSAEKVELDSEWGAEREANEVHARKGFEALEWDAATIDAVEQAAGYKAVMKLGAMVGRMTAEATRGDQGTGSGELSMPYGLTTEGARQMLKAKGPELARKARAGDASAKAELDRLNTAAWHS